MPRVNRDFDRQKQGCVQVGGRLLCGRSGVRCHSGARERVFSHLRGRWKPLSFWHADAVSERTGRVSPVLMDTVGEYPRAEFTTMPLKQKVTGGVLAFIGYLLSPLSWWNDMFINVPLALVFAWLISAVYKPAFSPAVVLGYWLTNVLGFVLMHKGAKQMVSGEKQPYSRRELIKDVIISLLYTLLIVVLLKTGVLKPFQNYFSSH